MAALWILAAILIIILVPGFTLFYALFPRAKMSSLESSFIAIFLGVGISSMVGVWTLQTGAVLEAGRYLPITLGLSGIFFFAGYSRRNPPRDSITRPTAQAGAERYTSSVERTPWVAWISPLILLLIMAISIERNKISYSIENSSLGYSEVYIAPTFLESVNARNLYSETGFVIPVVIENHENTQTEYRLAAFGEDRRALQELNFILADEEIYYGQIEIPMEDVETIRAVDLILYDAQTNEIMGELRVWLNE